MPSGRLKTGKTTMQDIADRMKISKVSVSKALNGQKGVSEELRQRIIQTAQEMNYSRTESADTFRFAFVVSKRFFLETDAFYSEMYYYFNKQCIALGHTATLMIVNHWDEINGILPSQLQKEKFGGIVIAGEMQDRFLAALASLELPLTLMDFDTRIAKATTLLTDNYYWGYTTTQYLIDLGHKKIGFIGQPGATGSITDRFFGYCRALCVNQLPYRKDWILANNDPETGIYQASITLPEEMPTAFVCHCDMAAHYLLMTLNGHGIQCPNDVSILSFDNTRLAQSTKPPLTSVSIDTRAFAQQALNSLCTLANGKSKVYQRIYIPASMVLRQSTAPLQQSTDEFIQTMI